MSHVNCELRRDLSVMVLWLSPAKGSAEPSRNECSLAQEVLSSGDESHELKH